LADSLAEETFPLGTEPVALPLVALLGTEAFAGQSMVNFGTVSPRQVAHGPEKELVAFDEQLAVE
jgi:hypothetical protein